MRELIASKERVTESVCIGDLSVAIKPFVPIPKPCVFEIRNPSSTILWRTVVGVDATVENCGGIYSYLKREPLVV